MDAGRDLDVEVARRVAKLAVVLDDDGNHRAVDPILKKIVPLPHYSSDTNDAYLLINLLQGQGLTCKASSDVASGAIVWSVTFSDRTRRGDGRSEVSLPHAACLAALDLVDK